MSEKFVVEFGPDDYKSRIGGTDLRLSVSHNGYQFSSISMSREEAQEIIRVMRKWLKEHK